MPQDDGSDPVNVATDLNDNLEKLDSSIGFVPSTSGSPPVAPYNGMAAHETDTGRAKFWFAALNTWKYVVTAGSLFIGNVTLDNAYRIGIGLTSPTALLDMVVSSISAVPILKARNGTDGYSRFQIDSDGIRMGGGTVATDTRLYRSATSTLSVTGSVIMENNLNVTGTTSVGALNVTGNFYLDGQVTSDLDITGDLSGTGKGVTTYLRKTTATSRLSTITPANDPEMLVNLDASTIYYVEMFIAYKASTTGDFRSVWSVPSGATGYRWCLGEAVAGTDRENTSMRTGGHNLTSEIVYGGHSSGVTSCGWETLYITTTTAGTLNFKWSQGTSDGTNATILSDGTFMRVTKVA
jgi:hypothetical protein